MYQRRQRRFRRRSNGRGHQSRVNGDIRLRTNLYTNDQPRNHFRSSQNAEQLYEKYSDLAKEALTSGDRTSSENYLQHADHFRRIIEEKKKNQNRIQAESKPPAENKNTEQSSAVNQSKATETKEEKK